MVGENGEDDDDLAKEQQKKEEEEEDEEEEEREEMDRDQYEEVGQGGVGCYHGAAADDTNGM